MQLTLAITPTTRTEGLENMVCTALAFRGALWQPQHRLLQLQSRHGCMAADTTLPWIWRAMQLPTRTCGNDRSWLRLAFAWAWRHEEMLETSHTLFEWGRTGPGGPPAAGSSFPATP